MACDLLVCSRFSTAAPAEASAIAYNYEILDRALEHPDTPEAFVRDVVPCKNQKEVPMDGNQAASYVAYAMSETSFIYPISPVCCRPCLRLNFV